MAEYEWVCCRGCGRDVRVKVNRDPNREVFCYRCIGRGSHISEQRGRCVYRSSMDLRQGCHEDDYSEESKP